MEVKDLYDQKKQLYAIFTSYINSQSEFNSEFVELSKYIQNQKFRENTIRFLDFIHLLLIFAKYHRHYLYLFNKIEQILLLIKDDLKQTFTKEELLEKFFDSKIIIYFLLKNEILVIDEDIYYQLKYNNDTKILHFLYPEFKKFIDNDRTAIDVEKDLFSEDPNILVDFDKKRLQGENATYLCRIIRQDSIEKFVKYVTLYQNGIKPSIFETNNFLLERKENIQMIEYAAFFGSLKIFNYLRMKGAKLTPSLWLFAIHSRSPKLIHILEDCHVPLPDKLFNSVLEEAVKCHHNEFAYYIQLNNPDLIKDEYFQTISHYLYNPIDFYCFNYYNYEFLNYDCDYLDVFLFACISNHFDLVKFLYEKIRYIKSNFLFRVFN